MTGPAELCSNDFSFVRGRKKKKRDPSEFKDQMHFKGRKTR